MKDKRGFTLVEVIISIAALGIICAVLLRLFVVAGNTNTKAADMQGAELCAASVVETLAGADTLRGGLDALGLDYTGGTESEDLILFKDGYKVSVILCERGDYPGALYDIGVNVSVKDNILASIKTAKYYKEGFGG